MEKRIADEFIHMYMNKVYGFSVSKTFNLAEADEICSEIIYEVYSSLLKIPELYNPDGYVWRISENVYSKYVMAKKREAHTPIDGLEIPAEPDFEAEDDLQREYAVLRREIAYLTKTRREIIVLFYFEKQKITKIARTMKLSEGTVKWHLNRARDELKEGLRMERTIGKLGIAPIKFTGMGHNGNPGKLGGPEAYITGTIEQNVLYSVYFTPKNESEISDELGIAPVYLDDIISKLENNGFLTRVKNDKFTTYVNITPATYSLEAAEKEYTLQLEIVRLLKDEYAPLVREAAEKMANIYLPGGNRALLYATLLTYSIMFKSHFHGETADLSKYYIKPSDGGDYIANAFMNASRNDPDYTPKIHIKNYWICGSMTRGSEKYPGISSWSIDSDLSAREGSWKNNLVSDYEYLYEFISGKLDKGLENAEKYKRLYDRRFIGIDDKVQVIVSGITQNELCAALPEFPETLKAKLAEFSGKGFETKKQLFPPQMHDLVREETKSVITSQTVTMLLDMMMENKELPAFTDTECVTLNLIMFSDKLPK
jgi:RNA polymerase sigma factor (sigma-70 family)